MSKRGFTLVEALVSSFLLVAVTFSFFYVFKNGARFEKKAEEKTKEAYQIQAKMEELRSLSFSKLLLQNGKDGVKIIPVDSDLAEVRLGEIFTLRAK